MKSILKLFTEHSTFIQPDALKYITSKDNPNEFASFLIKNLKEYPLVLTVDNIKKIEEKTKNSIIPDINEIIDKKSVQNEILNEMYNNKLLIKDSSDNNEFEEKYVEDQFTIKKTENVPKPIKINNLKRWKPIAKDYNSEIEIIEDITGKSNCEGTTQDFVKLFRDR